MNMAEVASYQILFYGGPDGYYTNRHKAVKRRLEPSLGMGPLYRPREVFRTRFEHRWGELDAFALRHVSKCSDVLGNSRPIHIYFCSKPRLSWHIGQRGQSAKRNDFRCPGVAEHRAKSA